MSHITITEVVARDVRFPTSENLDGSDAMNQDSDYSAAYVILKTDSALEFLDKLYNCLAPLLSVIRVDSPDRRCRVSPLYGVLLTTVTSVTQ
jgi:hypothetical protein